QHQPGEEPGADKRRRRHRARGARPRRPARRRPTGAPRSAGLRSSMSNGLVWLGPREMAWRETAGAKLPPDHVRVKVQAVGICGSELSGYLGHNSLRVPPLVMGHEFSGVVEEVGVVGGLAASGRSAGAAAGVPAGGLAVGARVVVNPLLTCG